jgi:hypothetical protein
MLNYIPKKLKAVLLLVTIPCGSVVGAYFLLPAFGYPDYVSGKNWFMYTCIAATLPLLVFKVAHVPVSKDRKVNDRIETLFSLGIGLWLGAFALFISRHWWLGALVLIGAGLFIVAAHLKWILSVASPHQVIIEEGERLLAQETDHDAKRQLAANLERLKKG